MVVVCACCACVRVQGRVVLHTAAAAAVYMKRECVRNVFLVFLVLATDNSWFRVCV